MCIRDRDRRWKELADSSRSTISHPLPTLRITNQKNSEYGKRLGCFIRHRTATQYLSTRLVPRLGTPWKPTNWFHCSMNWLVSLPILFNFDPPKLIYLIHGRHANSCRKRKAGDITNGCTRSPACERVLKQRLSSGLGDPGRYPTPSCARIIQIRRLLLE